MATIQNDRDILLQSATVRVVPVQIPIEQVTGLPGVLDGINDELVSQSSQISSVMNNTKDLLITASSTVFSGSSAGTTPDTITLTAVLKNGLTGTVTWSVTAGSITISPSGNTCMLTGTTMLSQSVTIRARLVSGNTYDAFITIARLGALASQNTVNLTSQVTGALNSNNVTGLGALALLNTVNLNTQTTGTLNGATQVTNLGSLAYANAIAANQIGAGTLAAGVVYAGTINADNITSGTITGRKIRSAASGPRVEVLTDSQSGYIEVYGPSGLVTTISQYGLGVGGNSLDGAFRVDNSVAGPHIVLIPRPGIPSTTVAGAISYTHAHGFIFSNGTGWFKPTWTPV